MEEREWECWGAEIFRDIYISYVTTYVCTHMLMLVSAVSIQVLTYVHVHVNVCDLYAYTSAAGSVKKKTTQEEDVSLSDVHTNKR